MSTENKDNVKGAPQIPFTNENNSMKAVKTASVIIKSEFTNIHSKNKSKKRNDN